MPANPTTSVAAAPDRGSFFAKPAPAEPPAPARRRVTKDEWRRVILPRQVARAGDDAEQLLRIVDAGIAYGCADAVLGVAEHLAQVDVARGRVAQARALLACGRVDEAEAALGDDAAHAGASLCRARVAEARGDLALADDLLWRALRADPNHAEALAWWTALHLDGASRVADLPGAWRARLALAEHALRNGNVPHALAHLRVALARARGEPDAVRGAAEALARHRQHRALVELVHPAYDPDRHDARTGLALLDACTESHDLARGRALLTALAGRHRDEVGDRLRAIADQLHAELPEPAAARAEPAALTLVPLAAPCWFAALRQPGWLLPARIDGAPRIDVLQLACAGDEPAGAWARALPLALAEALAARGADARASLAVVAGSRVADVDAPWTDDEALALAQHDDGVADFVVAGRVRHGSGQCAVSLTVYDVARGRAVHSVARAGAADLFGLQLPVVLDGLAAAMGVATGVGLGGDPRLLGQRLAAIDHLARLDLAIAGHVPQAALLERVAGLETCARLAQAEGASAADRLLLLAATAGDEATGSRLHREHHDEVLALVESERDGASPFARSSPLALWLFERRRDFRARRDALLATERDAAYRAWLERIGEEAGQFIVLGDDL